MPSEIIPFGKYKGQPVEILQQDKQYLEWLQSQDWFKQRYGNINTVIKYLIAKTFSATGASLNEVKDIFERSGKCFYLFSEFMVSEGVINNE